MHGVPLGAARTWRRVLQLLDCKEYYDQQFFQQVRYDTMNQLLKSYIDYRYNYEEEFHVDTS